jgi:putative ABC transport system permease protein
MNFIALDYWDLAIGATLVLLNGLITWWLRLGLARSLLIATVRMLVQLAVLGLVLKVLFQTVSPWLTALAALAMVLFAGREVLSRQDRKLTGAWGYGVGATCMLFAGVMVTVFALTTQLQADPWYHPRFALPLLGMILGNTMTGIAVGQNAFTSRVEGDRVAIEAMLALGMTRRAALQPFLRQAVRAGLIPVISSMSAMGVVFLPGMMTGQILAGIDPTEAIKYQIFVMFLIAGGTALGVVTAAHVTAYRLSDSRHRLRLDRLRGP